MATLCRGKGRRLAGSFRRVGGSARRIIGCMGRRSEQSTQVRLLNDSIHVGARSSNNLLFCGRAGYWPMSDVGEVHFYVCFEGVKRKSFRGIVTSAYDRICAVTAGGVTVSPTWFSELCIRAGLAATKISDSGATARAGLQHQPAKFRSGTRLRQVARK